jgi:hypothetical protein
LAKAARLVAEFQHRPLHVAQVGAAVARLVARERLVDRADDRLAVPLGGTPVPVVETDLAAEMEHQRLERRRRIEGEADGVQLGLGRHQVRAKTAQVLHEDERVLLLLEKPDAHEGGEVAVVAVVAQEHLGRRQCRPFGDGVHLDGLRLLLGQPGGVEPVPWNVDIHVPADGLELPEKFGIEHRLALQPAEFSR